MGTRHLILVWYKGKWQIAQYGQWDGYPEGQGSTVLKFLTNRDKEEELAKRLDLANPAAHTKDSDKSKPSSSQSSILEQATAFQDKKQSTTAASTSPRDNIAALRTALDNEMLYTPTKEQLQEINTDAEKVSEEGQRLKGEFDDGSADFDSEEGLARYQHLMDAVMKPLLFIEPSLSRDIGAGILAYVAYAKEKVPIKLEVKFIMSFGCEWAYVIDLDEGLLEVYVGDEYASQGTGRFENMESCEDGMYGGKRPRLLVKYRFEELQGLSEEAFVDRCRRESMDEEEYEYWKSTGDRY